MGGNGSSFVLWNEGYRLCVVLMGFIFTSVFEN
jgi:hypothetical protein